MGELVARRDAPNRKTLIVNGARQVGKTGLCSSSGGSISMGALRVLHGEEQARTYE